MQDIRRQFSLDWLVGKQADSSSQAATIGQSALDEAVVFYSQPILNRLAEATNFEMGLHDLARAVSREITQFSFDELWEVIKHLAGMGIVEIADASDPAGNYLIRLCKQRVR